MSNSKASTGCLKKCILVVSKIKTIRPMPMVRLELATPGLQTQCPSHWAIQLKSYCWEGVEFIQLVYCIIIYLSFLNCDWLLIREVQWFYWTQELLVPVEKFIVRMPMVRLELATPGLQTQCSSHWAIQLKSYCWEGVEFIQLVYCIIIYLSFLNCDWLLIWEVQWFYWTQELLVQVEKFIVRMPMVRHELATPGLHMTVWPYDRFSNFAFTDRSQVFSNLNFDILLLIQISLNKKFSGPHRS